MKGDYMTQQVDVFSAKNGVKIVQTAKDYDFIVVDPTSGVNVMPIVTETEIVALAQSMGGAYVVANERAWFVDGNGELCGELLPSQLTNNDTERYIQEFIMHQAQEQQITPAVVWEALWSSGVPSWIRSVRTVDKKPFAFWSEDGKPNIKRTFLVRDDDGDWHDVSMDNVMHTLKTLMSKDVNATHCGDIPLSPFDADECFCNIVLQHTIFNEMIFDE